MPDFKITMRCAAGHEQQLYYRGVGLMFVHMQAALLDGSSPFYQPTDVPSTVIGVCQYGRHSPANPQDVYPATSMESLREEGGCGEPFRCTVEQLPEGALDNLLP